MEKLYPLPLSRHYVRHWGVIEAIRELIQNGIDSPADFEYALLEDGLVLRSRGVVLDPSTLVLGITSKADDEEKIGSFGEGYKIALLVLARGDFDVEVINGNVIWTPEFRHSDAFGAEVLHIVEHPRTTPGDTIDLEFRILGLSAEELQAVQDSCLLMQPPMDDTIEVAQGRILPSRPGRLYVGGLFICETNLQFGYDVKPQHIELERDRQTVADWELKRLTYAMWEESGQDDYVAELIEGKCPDLEWVEYGGPAEKVAEACYRRFSTSNPSSIPVTTQDQYNRAMRYASYPIFVGGAYYRSITSSQSYQRSVAVATPPATPQQQLQAMLDKHRRRMQRLPRRAMQELITQAEHWRIA